MKPTALWGEIALPKPHLKLFGIKFK